MKKVKLLTRCCNDCLMKETFRGKVGCVLKDPHFDPKKLEVINDCANWQN